MASSDTLAKTVSKDDIICYCFSVTYEEAEKLFLCLRIDVLNPELWNET